MFNCIFNYSSRDFEDFFLWFGVLASIKIFWLLKEKKLLYDSKMLDIDGNPLVNPAQGDSDSSSGYESLPRMKLNSIDEKNFKLLN